MGGFERGREIAGTLARRGGQAIVIGLRVVSIASILANVIGNDDAASAVVTVLAAITKLGGILASLGN
ncbi:hypothetical protein ACTD5D_22080 [Nocardia takedensis]|uniref:hypothetical protein n=1 Tax=Nocardia takedensis TaxID=259390 RepID=UPI0005945BB0|nr:hypothetical protein [Nocardia takedensis]